jgi:hypothetical protein
MKAKKETFVRLNSRVRKVHMKLVKDLAKKNGKSEGEVTRIIFDYYMSKNK